jgi:TRAP-type mannitol/chloroaromatic compound transport system permease small subunit
VAPRFLENSYTLALGVFIVRVIAMYETVFLRKNDLVSEIGRIVFLLGMCMYHCFSQEPLSYPIGGGLGVPSAAIPSTRLL